MTLSASSPLLYIDPRYGVTPIVGGKPTHVRSSTATWIDQSGVLQTAPANTPRFERALVAGERRPVLRLEQARKNICLQSENFGTTWVAVGTPTRVAAAHTLAGVSLDLIGDDDGAGAEGYKQAISFTGNGGKNLSLFVKQGSSTSAFIELVDATAPSTPFAATIAWAAGLPAISGVSGGSYWGYFPLADGVFRLIFAISSTITAAHTNEFYVLPATVGGSGGPTGTLYVGGVQLEDSADQPASYIKTTTASVSQAVETLAYAFEAVPQAMMIYSRIVERGTYFESGFQRVWQLGKADNTTPLITLFRNTTRYAAYHHNGSASVSQELSSADHTLGDVIEHVYILYANGSVEIIESINGAAVSAAGPTGANALAAAWSDKFFWPNGVATIVGVNQFDWLKVVKYADVVAATAQGRMNELRAFELDGNGQLLIAA